MGRVMRGVVVGVMVIGLSACAYNRNEQLPFASGSQSNLSRKNFRVVRANVQGISHGFNFLGFIPIVSPSISGAMHSLHEQVSAEGKAIALVNVAQDHSTIYLILFSIPALTISADAVEFLDEPGAAPAAAAAAPATAPVAPQ